MGALLSIVLLLLLAWMAFAFNRLIRLRNQMRTGWADIDVQLSRRHDLVPQLVAAVAAYASHENTLLRSVADLRSAAMRQTSPARLGEAEAALEQNLGRLLALHEAYPALKASENFAQLQRELVTVEDHLQYARRFYNGAVRDYNDAVQRVPDMLIAHTFAFHIGEFYQAQADERVPATVRLP